MIMLCGCCQRPIPTVLLDADPDPVTHWTEAWKHSGFPTRTIMQGKEQTVCLAPKDPTQ